MVALKNDDISINQPNIGWAEVFFTL